MAPGIGILEVVDAPAFLPPPNGLLNSAVVIDASSDERFEGGHTFAPESTADLLVYNVCANLTAGDVVGTVNDAVTTIGSPTVTSASAQFTVDDVAKSVTGTNIPGGTTIASVTNGTTVVLSANATASGTGGTLAVVNRHDGPNRLDPLTFTPFIVQAKDTCFARGFKANDYEGRARRALAARETVGVEAEFWLGTADSTNRHLQDNSNTASLRSGSALGMRTALQVLVQAIADLKLGVGMIHARPGLVAGWSALNMIEWRNGKLVTINGNIIVPGYGYPGTGPNGQAVSPSSEWAYVTEAVTVKRGDVGVLGADNGPVDEHNFNKTRNLVTTRAQRAYSVQFNAAAVAAAQVDPTSTN